MQSFFPLKCVISGCDEIRARLKELLGRIRRDAVAVGGIFTVDHCHIRPQLAPQCGKPPLQKLAPHIPYNITDK